MSNERTIVQRLLRRPAAPGANHVANGHGAHVEHRAPAALGAMADQILESQGTSEAHELGRTFLEIAENGFIEDYDQLLADHVVYLVSGRSHIAGLHQGKAAVLAALGTPPAAHVTVVDCVATELMATGSRAIAVARIDGHIRGSVFTMEVAFHLQCEEGLIVAITEYSSDQYLADRLVAMSGRDHVSYPSLGEGPHSALPG